jgi:hypothetical protein
MFNEPREQRRSVYRKQERPLCARGPIGPTRRLVGIAERLDLRIDRLFTDVEDPSEPATERDCVAVPAGRFPVALTLAPRPHLS